MKLFEKAAHVGVPYVLENEIHRYIVITNKLSLLISSLTLIMFLGGLVFFGPLLSVKLSFCFALVFLMPLALNQAGHYNASRWMVAIIISVSSVITSVFDKFEYTRLEELQYVIFRVTLLCSSVLPFIVFRLEERRFWLSAVFVNLTTLVLFDPIHNYFDVGYFQLGFTGPNYHFLNVIFIACFTILNGSTYFLKISFENSENKNQDLIKALSLQQNEVLKANALINEQRALLEKENVNLNNELIAKNNQLVQTNEELIQHNNDLQQFSYTVSHNLRGPVASLLGLMILADKSTLSEQNKTLFDHLQKSVFTLDTTIKDLSNIIDIRNAISKIKQRIHIKDELDQILLLLQKNVEDNQVDVKLELEATEIYSVRPMINSILYNLISNAIKYRSEDRKPAIQITTSRSSEGIRFQIKDNGIGIDLVRYKEKIFGLYKRFHTHVDGKGLGLFLVKLQTESLGGRVEIVSLPGVGSTVNIVIPDAANPDHQIIMDKEWGKLYYDAFVNTTFVIWKRALHVNEFKEFFQRCVEFNNSHQCPNWIAEIKKGTKADDDNEEYNRARLAFANEMKRTALKRLAYVISKENEPADFELYQKQLIDFYQGRIKFYKTIDEALQWILIESAKEKAEHTLLK
ncbi:MAG: HAMP domain-containing histidine kinase [Cyclobacteriaceae bacterium]|nr:HAMP domain-containing histidine kinase [Cyclobacteriaceae bacterium]